MDNGKKPRQALLKEELNVMSYSIKRKVFNSMLLHVLLRENKMKYNYDELLKRACSQMPQVSLKRERLELPRLFISTVGMRTIISNFKEAADVLDRDPQHILKFLTREMATAATFHDSRAIFQGKFQRGVFERLLQRYMESFVICPVCKRPDTKIVKEKRLAFLVCNACGAKSSIKQL